MHLDDIRKVLQHCYTRQTESGAESAFRFLIIIGPKRKHVRVISRGLDADEINSRKERMKKKGKGKQRANPFEGLLSMSPNPTVAGGPDRIGSEPVPGRQVRITMQQMVQLKEKGFEISGPVNGPNEGLPEYLVPEEWLNSLSSEQLSEVGSRPYPRPRLIPPTNSFTSRQPSITDVQSRHYPQPRPIPPTDEQIDPLLRRQTQGPSLVSTSGPANAALTLSSLPEGLTPCVPGPSGQQGPDSDPSAAPTNVARTPDDRLIGPSRNQRTSPPLRPEFLPTPLPPAPLKQPPPPRPESLPTPPTPRPEALPTPPTPRPESLPTHPTPCPESRATPPPPSPSESHTTPPNGPEQKGRRMSPRQTRQSKRKMLTDNSSAGQPPGAENPEAGPSRQPAPTEELGKKRQLQISPRKTRQTKKKKTTDDVRATHEAEELGGLGKRQRRKPTRHQ
jgi:hypothetical protein